MSVSAAAPQQTRDARSMLAQRWASVADGDPTLYRHWVNVSFFTGSASPQRDHRQYRSRAPISGSAHRLQVLCVVLRRSGPGKHHVGGRGEVGIPWDKEGGRYPAEGQVQDPGKVYIAVTTQKSLSLFSNCLPCIIRLSYFI